VLLAWSEGVVPRGDEMIAAVNDRRKELEQLWVNAEVCHACG